MRKKSIIMGDMLKRALFFISIILPFLIIVKPIIEGNIPFWYDPARDLLMAWDNLSKLTLIGPTSGIPGIFYGPHWIWLLSIGVAISKDPKFVVFLILTIPHFILLLLSVAKLKDKLIDWKTMISIWIISIIVLSSYANQIWSPNLAPVLFFLLLTLLYLTKNAIETKSIKQFLLMGLIQGLLLEHQISFGIALTVGWIFYFICLLVEVMFDKKNKKKFFTHWIINAGSFAAGFLIMQAPFFLFEIRHGFMQTKSLFFTLSQSIAHNLPVVGNVGLTRIEIIQKFFDRGAGALSLPIQFSQIISILLIFIIIFNFIKKKIYNHKDKNLLIFLGCTIGGLFFVYFGTQNPVWNYHFTGVEIIFLFLMMLAVKKNKILESGLFIWAIVLLIVNTGQFVKSFTIQRHTSELVLKEKTVKFILDDAKTTPFIYLAKNASIYTYDYDYLFRWIGTKKNKHPVTDIQTAKNIYLIIPGELSLDKVGFTENRTPSSKYKTEKEWVREDKTIVIKRVIID